MVGLFIKQNNTKRFVLKGNEEILTNLLQPPNTRFLSHCECHGHAKLSVVCLPIVCLRSYSVKVHILQLRRQVNEFLVLCVPKAS